MSEREIKLCSQQQCTGCMACLQKCKHGAIIKKDVDGFFYPFIDEFLCKHCGQCMEACPILNISTQKGIYLSNASKCFAVWSKDTSVRMQSSSGGVFSVLANKIIETNGIVFGAAWNSEMVLEHRGVSEKSDIDVLRRSKYVQSDPKNSFNEVQEHLKAGRPVLYCGTPCQIAGLTAFLGYKNYENLYKVDVLCQGVPSPWSLKKYLSEIEKSKGIKITNVNFRSKSRGWRCGLLLLLEGEKNGEKIIIERKITNNEFYNSFIREYFLRESCYHCQFKKHSNGYFSDITIGDFWRIGDKIPFNAENIERGVSAVVFNTQKGQKLLESCADNIIIKERTYDELATNGGIYNSHKPANNDAAYTYLKCHTWHETQKKFFSLSRKQKIRIWLYLMLGEKKVRIIRKLVKKVG